MGVDSMGGNAQPLKALSQSYIEKRRKDRRLAAETSPETSNLTLTGRMLKNITWRRKAKSVRMYFRGSPNLAKARHVSKDRPFFFLTKEEVEHIRNLFLTLTKGL